MGSGKDRSWEYGSMKLAVADHLTYEDCQRAGQLIGLKPAPLEKIKGGRELLAELEKRGKLSMDNLQFLKDLLEKIEIIQAITPVEEFEKCVEESKPAASSTGTRDADSTDSKEQPDYTKSHMKTLISESKLSDLSDRLGKDWKRFCLQKLQLKQFQIDNCEYGKSHLPDVVFECLSTWRQTVGYDATYGELAKLLSEFGYPKEIWVLLETPD